MYTLAELTNPPAAWASRRLLLPVRRFCDNDVAASDYASWGRTASRFSHDRCDVEHTAQLAEAVRRDGLRSRVDILADSEDGPFSVLDGHHRVVLLKELGVTHIPYRWSVLGWSNTGYRRGRLPETRRSI